VLKAGGPGKADLLLVDLGQGVMVVKDFARKSRWTRLLGRIQIGREYRAYRWLGPIPGIPGLFGRIDAHAFAMERIEADQLALTSTALSEGERILERLTGLVHRLHAAGLVHHDLRGRENVLLRPDGELVVVDLAAAAWFRPGGLAHRLLFRFLAKTDVSALLKWKEILMPGRFTPEERAFLRRFRFLRSLWVFNRKRPIRRKETP